MTVFGRNVGYFTNPMSGMLVSAHEAGLTADNTKWYGWSGWDNYGNDGLLVGNSPVVGPIVAYSHDTQPHRSFPQVVDGQYSDLLAEGSDYKLSGVIRSSAQLVDLQHYNIKQEALSGPVINRPVRFEFDAKREIVRGFEIVDGRDIELNSYKAEEKPDMLHWALRSGLLVVSPQDKRFSFLSPQIKKRDERIGLLLHMRYRLDSRDVQGASQLALHLGMKINSAADGYQKIAAVLEQEGLYTQAGMTFLDAAQAYADMSQINPAMSAKRQAARLFIQAQDAVGVDSLRSEFPELPLIGAARFQPAPITTVAPTSAPATSDKTDTGQAELLTKAQDYLNRKWSHMPEAHAAILAVIKSTIENPVFQNDPQAYVQAWRQRRGNLESLNTPYDQALQFFEELYADKSAVADEPVVADNADDIFYIPEEVGGKYLAYYEEWRQKPMGQIYVEAHKNKEALDANTDPKAKLELLAKLIASIAAIQRKLSGQPQGFISQQQAEELYSEFGFDPQGALIRNSTGDFIGGYSGLE